MTFGILTVFVMAVGIAIGSRFGGRNAQPAPTPAQNAPAAPAAGAPPPTVPVTGGNTTMSSMKKFLIGINMIVIIALIVVGIVYAVSGSPGQWLAQWIQKTSPVTIIFYIAILTFGVMIGLGLKEHWKAKESKGPKILVTILAVLLTAFLAVYSLYGPDAIERFFQDRRGAGDSFANRVPGHNTPNKPSAQRRLPLPPPSQIKLPRCTSNPKTGWSTPKDVRPDLRFEWTKDVDAQYLSGTWHDVTVAKIPDIVSELRFCTQYVAQEDTYITVTWFYK